MEEKITKKMIDLNLGGSLFADSSYLNLIIKEGQHSSLKEEAEAASMALEAGEIDNEEGKALEELFQFVEGLMEK